MSLERFARSFQHPQCYGLSISLQRQNKRFYTVYLLQPALCGYIPKEPRFTTLEACTHSRSRQPSRQTFCIWFPNIYITGDKRVGLLSTGSKPVILTVVRTLRIARVPRIERRYLESKSSILTICITPPDNLAISQIRGQVKRGNHSSFWMCDPEQKETLDLSHYTLCVPNTPSIVEADSYHIFLS